VVTGSVTEVLRALFPANVEVEGGRAEEVEGRLFPEEEALIARAVEKRRREFRAGRVLARRALSRLGVSEAPILAKERRPLWPAGIVGSISHAGGCCAVAVARRGGLVGIGLDVEIADAVTEPIFARISTPEERTWLLGRSEPRRWATLVFSAKEAFYKSLAAVHDDWVGFQDVRVEIDDDERFRVVPLAEAVRASLGEGRVVGRWRRHAPWVFASATLEISA
jgi:4'-phosphopantetheinyl transferase EntD